MIEQIKQARREKIVNKTRERARERAGEILKCTLERRKKGLPAHLIAVMSKEEIKKDKLLRESGRAGYVNWLKTGVWGEADEGKKENWDRLDEMEEQILAENERKRTALELDGSIEQVSERLEA